LFSISTVKIGGSMEFQIGDVVRLKSGGVNMTVTEIGDRVKCEWQDAEGDGRQAAYPAAALEKVDLSARPPRIRNVRPERMFGKRGAF
jgi:uncharacterized protein YodC (DUF2158 family)